jgi:hypothetical protein
MWGYVSNYVVHTAWYESMATHQRCSWGGGGVNGAASPGSSVEGAEKQVEKWVRSLNKNDYLLFSKNLNCWAQQKEIKWCDLFKARNYC